jgi:hypothetical protein
MPLQFSPWDRTRLIHGNLLAGKQIRIRKVAIRGGAGIFKSVQLDHLAFEELLQNVQTGALSRITLDTSLASLHYEFIPNNFIIARSLRVTICQSLLVSNIRDPRKPRAPSL